MREIRNLIIFVPRTFLFVDEEEHLILVLLQKANVEHKEICASDCLKPPISMLLTHTHSGFYVLYPRFGFTIQEAYLKFKPR